MGPGYFPVVLGGLLILFGLYILATGLRSGEKLQGSGRCARSIVHPARAVPVRRADRPVPGFVPAMMVLIFGSATASTEFRFLEVLLFSVFLTALCGRRVHLRAWPALSAVRGI